MRAAWSALSEQDRSLWFDDELTAGLELVASLTPTEGYAEELRLQALIAGEHARASDRGGHRLVG